MFGFLCVVFLFGSLFGLLFFSINREKRAAENLYLAIEQGLLEKVSTLLKEIPFSNLRDRVLRHSIELAVKHRRPEILRLLLSKEIESSSWIRKFDNYLFEQVQRGGWRAYVFWRSKTSHPFEPWRDLSEKEKSQLMTQAKSAKTS